MHANTHARLMKAYHWVVPIMGILMFCFGSLWLMSGSANFIPALIFFVAAVIPFYLVLWHLPVRCKSPGCNGRMKWTMTQVSDWAPVVKSNLRINVGSAMTFTRPASIMFHYPVVTLIIIDLQRNWLDRPEGFLTNTKFS